MRQTTIPAAEREALIGAKITLNGEPAIISGTRRPFATITQKRSGLSAEWAWPSAQRIIARGGAFQS